MTDFQILLEKLHACPEARDWVADRTAKQAWQECQRIDWMFWLVEHLVHENDLHCEIVMCANDFARSALQFTSDQRVADCVAAVDRWLAGELVDLTAAARAAEATEVVARATGAAARAAEAGWSSEAVWSAHVAAQAAARATTLTNADIIRRHLPWSKVGPLIERSYVSPVKT